MNKLLYVIVALVALAAGVFLFYTFNLAASPPPEHSLYYKQPRTIKPFTLTDHHGKAFTNEQFKGKWSWVFFGYTSCPDVCPTTLQEFNFIHDELMEVSADNQVLLVSVDPQRDTESKLAQYIKYFNSAFIALRGDHSVLFPFARNMGLMYAITDDNHDNNNSGAYLVDHSASIVLVNPKGMISAIFKPAHIAGQLPTVAGSDMVSDFKKIVNLYNQ